MSPADPLKIAIYAAQVTPGPSGGVAQVILGLVHALGRLDDGPEEYLIIVDSQQQLDWLKPFLGPSQRFVMKPQQPNRGFFRRALERVLRETRDIERQMDGGTSRWPEVPVSDGFYESLGCDVIHFPHQEFILCALPAVYNPHDLLHLHYPQFFKASDIAWREIIYPGGCHLAHTVGVASQWIKEDVIRHYRLDPDKVQIIPWGAPTQVCAAPSPDYISSVAIKYGIEQPSVFFPAITWPHKNHFRLLEALAHLRDVHNLKLRLICTGSHNRSFGPQIERHIGELGLQSQVKFLGFVPEQDLRAIYRLSEFLVMPTLFESDSLPIFEAWLEGLPVACSSVCALPDQVMDAAVIFDPNHAESIADTMAQLHNNPHLQRQLRERGYQRIKDFEWERTAKAYRAVYRQAAGRPLSSEDQWLLNWDWMREPQKTRGSHV